MKHLLLTTIAAVVVGCGESQFSAPAPETKPEPPAAEAPDISIHDAADSGNIEVVKQHLAAGTDVNAKDYQGGTPLDRAEEAEHTEIANLLHKNGGKHGTIHGAAVGGDIKAVKEFLAAGTDVNTEDKCCGETPLHHAAAFGRKEMSEQLIGAGADVNAQSIIGVTALYISAVKGHKEIAELLIAKGANVNAKNDDGETPLDGAIEDNHTEIADLFRKHGGKTGTELKAEGK